MILQKLNNFFIFLLFIGLTSCNNGNYKYQISGWVDTKEGLKLAIWNTDTINFDGDTVYYVNSDKSVVRIYPPFIIKELKK